MPRPIRRFDSGGKRCGEQSQKSRANDKGKIALKYHADLSGRDEAISESLRQSNQKGKAFLGRYNFVGYLRSPHRDVFGLWREQELRRTDRPRGVQNWLSY